MIEIKGSCYSTSSIKNHSAHLACILCSNRLVKTHRARVEGFGVFKRAKIVRTFPISSAELTHKKIISTALLALVLAVSSINLTCAVPAAEAEAEPTPAPTLAPSHPVFEPRIFSPLLKPGEKARGVVITVHGTTQHAGSFETLAGHLMKERFVMVAVDLRGHGARYHRTKPGSGAAPVERRVDYTRSSDDLVAIFRQAKRRFPGLPLFCIGESVGAGVATKAAGNAPGLLDGLILCSAGGRPCFFNPLMVANDFVKGIWRLDHLMDVSRYIDRYSADDKRVSDEMISDPLSRIQLTPREILQTAFFIRRTPESAKKVDPSLPVLIVQGEIDHIVGAHRVKSIMKNLPSRDKQIVVLPKCGHVLMGTSFLKPEVIESVTKWLVAESSPKKLPIALDNEAPHHAANREPIRTEFQFSLPHNPMLEARTAEDAPPAPQPATKFSLPLNPILGAPGRPTIGKQKNTGEHQSAIHTEFDEKHTAAM